MKRDLGLVGISITDIPGIDLAIGSLRNDRAFSERGFIALRGSGSLAL